MIRRPHGNPAEPQQWLLIPQIDHAHLAGELAGAWGNDRFAPLPGGEEALAAIYAHDDGWRAWDAAPDIDPETGRPRNFLEMPLDTQLAIWRASIDRAASHGPLAPWMVAGHFAALLQGSSSSDTREGRAWLAEFDQRRQSWLAQCNASGCCTPAQTDQALAMLQMFDGLSLWFCCAPRSEPHSFGVPAGQHVSLAPDASQDPAETTQRVSISPWPMATDRLEIRVAGRLVPASGYRDQQSLLAELQSGPVALLRWQLFPG
ncbi:MAG: DUF3891 family protein [Pirellulales bacterium]